MRLTRVFVDGALICGELIELPHDTGGHLAKVLRARSGDEVILFNGDGREFSGTEALTLSTSQLPAHTHTLPGGGTTGTLRDDTGCTDPDHSWVGYRPMATVTTQASGGTSSTVEVDANNLHGWSFFDDNGNGALGAVHFVDAESNVVHTESGAVVLFGVLADQQGHTVGVAAQT